MVVPCASALPTGVLFGRWLAPSPAASPLGLVDLPSPGVAIRASEWPRPSATSPPLTVRIWQLYAGRHHLKHPSFSRIYVSIRPLVPIVLSRRVPSSDPPVRMVDWQDCGGDQTVEVSDFISGFLSGSRCDSIRDRDVRRDSVPAGCWLMGARPYVVPDRSWREAKRRKYGWRKEVDGERGGSSGRLDIKPFHAMTASSLFFFFFSVVHLNPFLSLHRFDNRSNRPVLSSFLFFFFAW